MKKILNYTMFIIIAVFCCLFFNITSVFGADDEYPTITVEVKGIDSVYVTPGQDSNTSVTISWHASHFASTLYFTTADDKTFTNAQVFSPKGELDNTTFHYYENVSFYQYTQYIDNLTPGTEYIYKISTIYDRRPFETSVKSFTTTRVTDYSFAWISDIHGIAGNDEYGGNNGYRVNLATDMINRAKDNFENLDFLQTTGDETWRGSMYTNWTQWSPEVNPYTDVSSTMMWCSGIGNHEYYCQFQASIWNYYPKSLSNNNSAIYGDYRYYNNLAYNSMHAIPKNGPTATKNPTSSYWYLAGSVLFINIDSMDCADYSEGRIVREWFEDVCKQNEGKYQYIVVGQHYAWIDPNDGQDKGKASSMSSWRELFEKYGVDLAISGHEHTYYRSYPLKNKQVVPSDEGTTYMVAPQIGNRTSSTTKNGQPWDGYWVDPNDQSNKQWIAKNIDDRSLNRKSGLTVITVTPNGLVGKFFDYAGTLKDEFTISPRRTINCSAYAESVANSVNTIVNSNDNTAQFLIPEAYVSLVKNMSVKQGDKTLGTLAPTSLMQNSLSISDVESNKLLELTLDFEFVDGYKYSVPYALSTFPYFGEIYGFEAKMTKDKMNFSWNAEILPQYSSLIDHYSVFMDDFKLADSSSCSISLDKMNELNANSKFYLKAIDANGNAIFVKEYSYSMYGDADLDGSISASDLDLLSRMIFMGNEVSGNLKTLTDVNGDGKVDYVDIVKIWMYNKEDKVNDLNYKVYTVVFKDLYGKTVATKQAKYGDDLSSVAGPELGGYEFAGWSQSVKYITEDMTVYAVYNN